MVALFRDKSFAGVFWLILLSILLHLHFFVTPAQVMITDKQGLMYLLLNAVQLFPPLIITILYHVIVIIQALRLNYILNDLRMFPKNAFTTAMAYVMLCALFPAWNNITPALIANSFIIWLVYRLAKLYNVQKGKPLIYNIGLITGSLVLVYQPALFLIIVMFFALAILRPFSVNESFVLLLGILTPFYILATVLFLNDNLHSFTLFLPAFYRHLLNPADKVMMLTTAITGGFLVLAGFYVCQLNNGRMVIQARKTWLVLLLMFLFAIPIIFFIQGAGFNVLLLSVVPAAAFAANIFVYPKSSLLPNILFWCLAAVIVYNNWWLMKY